MPNIDWDIMAGSFDHEDRSSWYFGPMSRQEAQDLLLSEKEGGVFLVRDSSTCIGDYVLCVRENNRVSHYIINKIEERNQPAFRIGDQTFADLPSLLKFYKVHYLDTTPLIRPAHKHMEQVIAKFDFEGQDPDDLPFKKGEVLTVVSKDEEQWWTAKNANGDQGSIPVPYVMPFDPKKLREGAPSSPAQSAQPAPAPAPPAQEVAVKKNDLQRQLPAKARVKQVRIPNAYDNTALKLEIGDIVTVTKMNINGQWEGEINGRKGFFPFTHIEFIDNAES